MRRRGWKAAEKKTTEKYREPLSEENREIEYTMFILTPGGGGVVVSWGGRHVSALVTQHREATVFSIPRNR